MSQISYNSEKLAKKKVLLYNDTSADIVLRGGWAVCYAYDATDISQSYLVERPATNNLLWFAGVITEEFDGFSVADGATRSIEIYVPTTYGQVVPVFISENHSANMALLEHADGSFILVEGTTNKVARSVQLVNRSSVNGTCLARLYGLSDPLA